MFFSRRKAAPVAPTHESKKYSSSVGDRSDGFSIRAVSRKSRRLSIGSLDFVEDYEDAHEEERREAQVLLQRYRDYVNDIERRLNYQDVKDWTRWFLDSATINIPVNFENLCLTMTFVVLFLDDYVVLFGNKDQDKYVVGTLTACLAMFILEFVLTTFAKSTLESFRPLHYRGYIFSFYWFVDLLAIVSISLEIPFITEGMGLGDLSNRGSNGTGSYSKSVQILRLVRIVRLVKIFRIAAQRRKQREEQEELLHLAYLNLINFDEERKRRALNDKRTLKLGSTLSLAITRNVICMMLIMLIIIPIITWTTEDSGYQYSTYLLHENMINANVDTTAKQAMINEYIDVMDTNKVNDYLVYLRLLPFNETPYVNLENKIVSLRSSSISDEVFSTFINGTVFLTEARFNQSYLLRESALYSILLTWLVGSMLVIGSIIFTNDAQKLVLDPIERMMNMVEQVAHDPLSPMPVHQISDAAADVLKSEYETWVLETTIRKITGLLRVGFGEAGAGIIKSNLEMDTNFTINPLLPGVRVYAIFGFCEICSFNYVTKALNDEVLVFVNTIAEIVHKNAHDWSGQCNKNLGNAFVIVWRIGDEHQLNAQRKASKPVGLGRSNEFGLLAKREVTNAQGYERSESRNREKNVDLGFNLLDAPLEKTAPLSMLSPRYQLESELSFRPSASPRPNSRILDAASLDFLGSANPGSPRRKTSKQDTIEMALSPRASRKDIKEQLTGEFVSGPRRISKQETLPSDLSYPRRVGRKGSTGSPRGTGMRKSSTSTSMGASRRRKSKELDDSTVGSESESWGNTPRSAVTPQESLMSFRMATKLQENFAYDEVDSSDDDERKEMGAVAPFDEMKGEESIDDQDSTRKCRGEEKDKGIRTQNGRKKSSPTLEPILRPVTPQLLDDGEEKGDLTTEISKSATGNSPSQLPSSALGASVPPSIIDRKVSKQVKRKMSRGGLPRRNSNALKEREPSISKVESTSRKWRRDSSPSRKDEKRTSGGSVKADDDDDDDDENMSSLGHNLWQDIENKRKLHEVDLRKVHRIDKIAEKALIAYLKTIVDLNRNRRVLAYRKITKLNEVRPFKVRMNFGVHAGWAIEGAVGSVQKVDATYLSPHVNLAARLETASKQYGVPLLMTQKVHELLSDPVQALCRKLDKVTVKGSEQPIELYTYDCLQDQEFVAPKRKPRRGSQPEQSEKRENMQDAAFESASDPLFPSKLSDVEKQIGTSSWYSAATASRAASISPSRKSPKFGSASPSVTNSRRITDRGTIMYGAASSRARNSTGGSAGSVKANGAMSSKFGAMSSKGVSRRGVLNMQHVQSSADEVDFKETATQFTRFLSEHVIETFEGDDADGSGSESALSPSKDTSKGNSLRTGPNESNRIPAAASAGSKERSALTSMVETVEEITDADETRMLTSVDSNVTMERPLLTGADIPQVWVSPTDDNTVEAFEKDYDLRMLRLHVTDAFKELFSEGLANYLGGDWVQAKINLENANDMMARNCPALGGDNPSKTLIKYMQQYDFVAPRTWKSYRPLVSK